MFRAVHVRVRMRQVICMTVYTENCHDSTSWSYSFLAEHALGRQIFLELRLIPALAKLVSSQVKTNAVANTTSKPEEIFHKALYYIMR